MPVSRSGWEATIEALKENTRQKNVSKAIDNIITEPTAQQKAEKAAGSLGGLSGNAAQQILERKRKQKELIDSY